MTHAFPLRTMVVVFAVLLAVTSTARGHAQDVTIGVIAPFTGPVPSFGEAVKNGVEMAVNEWNARGGVLGRRILAVYEDGQCTPEPAVAAARTLVNDGVHYVVGEVCSKASIPVSEVTNVSHVIQISPTSTNLAVTVDPAGRVKAYTFRNCFVDPFQGIVAAKFAYNRLSARTAYVLFDPRDDYVSGLAASFQKEFARLGGSILGKATYAMDIQDFSAILSGPRDARPDVVYFPDYYNVVNIGVRQARQMGIAAPFIGGDGWDSPDLDRGATEGCYFTNHFAVDDPRPEVRAFRSRYEASYPGAETNEIIAALAYDCADMLLHSINAVGDDVESVRRHLERTPYSGVTGTLTFDRHHNPIKTAVIMGIRNGEVRFDSSIEP